METIIASSITGTREPKVLTRGEVEAFARNGYHFPVRALTAEQAQAYRAKLEGAEARLGTPLMKTGYRNKPHLVFTWADELIRHPAHPRRGGGHPNNLLVWSSSLFMKEARDPQLHLLAPGSGLLGAEPSGRGYGLACPIRESCATAICAWQRAPT